MTARAYFDDPNLDRRFRLGQRRMLLLTIVGYTLFYFLRKNFAFAMPGLQQDLGVTKAMLGNCLLAGGLVYGVSKFLNGFVGDRVNPRRFLCFGLSMCALVNVAFAFAPSLAALFAGRAGAGADVAAVALVLGVLYVANQFFQGMGFPPCAKLIAFWIPPRELATKMSVWNTSHSIGGGLVAKICGVIMGLGTIGAANQGVGQWRWCFLTMAALGLVGVAILGLWLPRTPEDEGLPPCPGTTAHKDVSPASSPRASSRVVFALPALWLLGVANFIINAVRALIADWGPTLLQESKGLTSSASGTYIMLFEFAGIAGMLFAGWATDHWARGRSPRVCVFLMFLAALALAAFWLVPLPSASCFALCVFGFCLYGPQALTGVAATNLCGKQFAGTSIGFISLFSYIGVSVSGKICGSLTQASGGWQTSVWVIAATCAVGVLPFLLLWRTKADNYAAEEPR